MKGSNTEDDALLTFQFTEFFEIEDVVQVSGDGLERFAIRGITVKCIRHAYGVQDGALRPSCVCFILKKWTLCASAYRDRNESSGTG